MPFEGAQMSAVVVPQADGLVVGCGDNESAVGAEGCGVDSLSHLQVEKDGSITYLGLTDKFAECYEKQGKLMNSVGVGCVSSIDDRSYKSQKYFNNGNVATMVNFLYSTEHLREMEDDYGILPLPK